MIYLNSAATTWPKPEDVYATYDRCFREMDSPMRNSSEGVLHGQLMEECREVIAPFFGIANPARLILTPGCTYALNLAILGLGWERGDIAIMSGLEHHAVSRPIRKVAAERGIRFEVAPYEPGCPIDLNYIEDKLRGGRVRLLACTMASNVTGDVFPIKDVVALACRFGVTSLVDAAQAAGVLDIDVDALGVDLLAFAGHKGLYGPPGIGGLYVSPRTRLRTLAEGGTGGDSGKHGLSGSLPSSYEVGTHNLPAIAGLAAGVRWVRQTGVAKICRHERELAGAFIDGLDKVPGVNIFGSRIMDQRTGSVSITMDGTTPNDLATWLAQKHQVTTRAGFHCAPLSHETIGTLPGDGTVRFSFGYFNKLEEVQTVITHLAEAPRTVPV